MSDYSFGAPFVITLSDTANSIDPPLRGLCISAVGTIKFTSHGVDITLIVAAAPFVPPYASISRVYSTGTVTITGGASGTVHGIR